MKLKQYLKDNGLHGNAFAKRVGISASYLSQVINGKLPPSMTLKILIAKETNGAVDVSEWT
jgi:transcriptional regulator with XRE-family HTH domain